MYQQGVLRPGFEAGFNQASTRPQTCIEAITGSVEAWLEAGLNMASIIYQVLKKMRKCINREC